ncbi:BapA/Bap/LapF family prefix-like domain-containing protein, partial [Acinetobacter faecalis]
MSIYKIYDQATGKVVENGATANPIVVELNTERVNIKNILKDGNDLIVTLNSGEEITVKEFYNGEDANKLVIKETDGLYYEVNLSQLMFEFAAEDVLENKDSTDQDLKDATDELNETVADAKDSQDEPYRVCRR